jgi:lipid-A-disaccharide synthase
MLDAVMKVQSELPGARFGVVLAKSRKKEEVEYWKMRMPESCRDSLKIFDSDVYDVLNASDAAAVTSGTATLETAIIGTPQVIVYRTSALNYFLLRPLVNIRQFGLANLIAGKKVYNELLQANFSGESLGKELLRLLDPEVNQSLRLEAREINRRIGGDDAAIIAAREIINFTLPKRKKKGPTPTL